MLLPLNHPIHLNWLKLIKPFIIIAASPTVSLDEVQRLLILLNPKAGPGRAKEMFQTKIAPILTEAEISYDLYITKHPNYARDFVRLKDVYQWNGIVAVGGNALNLNQP